MFDKTTAFLILPDRAAGNGQSFCLPPPENLKENFSHIRDPLWAMATYAALIGDFFYSLLSDEKEVVPLD